MKKLVLFGAGKIGRSFIGQLFSRSGYEVVFVDINESVIRELNTRRRYKVVVKSEKDDVIWVENVRGVMGSDKEAVVKEIQGASLLAVSVGQRGLPHILPVIAESLKCRVNTGNLQPLDIIIAENMRNADKYIKEELLKNLSDSFPFNSLVGLVETSIGKMVPIMPKEEEEKDILQVFAEPYNTLVLDKKGFKNGVPEVPGLDAKENMKAWVDCKAFIHNFGHAVAAYIGHLYNPSFVYLYEALGEPEVKEFVRVAMFESAAILKKKYPGEFSDEFLKYHIDDLIHRFQNKALGDTIFRVGCDLRRKLGRNDRIVSPLMDGVTFGLPIDKIFFTLVCGYYFRAKNEKQELLPEDQEFVNELNSLGFNSILEQVSGIYDPSLKNIAERLFTMIPEKFKEFIEQ